MHSQPRTPTPTRAGVAALDSKQSSPAPACDKQRWQGGYITQLTWLGGDAEVERSSVNPHEQ